MRVAITGAQGTGKSTLLDALKMQPNIRYDYEFIDEITRRMARKGHRINEGGDDVTQILIVNEHIKNTLIQNCIMDRCILDGFVYTIWLYQNRKVSKWVADFAFNAFKTFITSYDHIFYIKPEFDLVDDGVRSVDIEFRNGVHDLFEEWVASIGEKPKVTVLTGTVEERLNQINSVVKW